MMQTTQALTAGYEDLPSPEPAAGTKAYVDAREASLAADERRAANYAKYLSWKTRGGEVDFLPIKLDVENVSRCNFRCVMCVVSDWDKGKRADDMTLETFKRLVDEQYGVVEIKLQGIGEPLMQGDDYFAMIRYARSRKIWVRVTTNASLLHLQDNYKKLIDAGVNEVQISVDGADKATFEKIRRGSVFERVISNIKLINDYARSVDVSVTKMWTIVQRDNAASLPQIVDLAHDLGFTNQVFMLNLIDWGLAIWHERNAELDVHEAVSPAALWALARRGEELGQKVWFWRASGKYSAKSRNTLCPWPFERSYVSSDMRVSPCCMIGNPDVYELGSGLADGFSKVWFGQEYEAFRRAHEAGEIPKACRNCYAPQ